MIKASVASSTAKKGEDSYDLVKLYRDKLLDSKTSKKPCQPNQQQNSPWMSNFKKSVAEDSWPYCNQGTGRTSKNHLQQSNKTKKLIPYVYDYKSKYRIRDPGNNSKEEISFELRSGHRDSSSLENESK